MTDVGPVRVLMIAALTGAIGGTAHAQSMQGDTNANHMQTMHSSESSVDANVQALLSATKNAIAEFQDRNVAIAAGYRRIGPDIPSMGEHWINPRLVLADPFDPAHPALLTYVMVDGKPQLTSAVFAVPLTAGQFPPTVFGNTAMWHEHNGTVAEEALLPDHHSAQAATRGTRLAILHAWVWSSNPDGVFATDNWTLPFVRLQLFIPHNFTEASARALSLLSGAEDYYAGLAGDSSLGVVAPILKRCEDQARKIAGRALASDRTLTDAELEELSRAWLDAVSAVEKASGGEAAGRINGGRHPQP